MKSPGISPLGILSKSKLFLPFKKTIIILFLAEILSSAFYFTGPYLSKLFIDNSFLKKDLHSFIILTLISGCIFIFSMLLSAIANIIKNRQGIKTKLALADKFISKFYSLDLEFFQANSAGENIYRLSDIERIKAFVIERLPNFFANIFRFFMVMAIALMVNLRLTIILVLLSPLFLIQSLYLRKKLKPIYEEAWRLSAQLSKKVFEAFSRMLLIKALGLEGTMRRAYKRLLLKNIRLGLGAFKWSLVSSLSSSFLSKAVFAVLSFYGGWMIIKGRLSLGSYTAAMLYLTQLGSLIKSLSSGFEFFLQDMISVDRFFELVTKEPAIKDSMDAITINSLGSEIEFKAVSFVYQPGNPVLKNICFKIPAQKWIAIVGPSGCGKTTLVSLILRLYDPWSGEIILDNMNLRKISLKSLRERISIATQEPFLFDLSFRENIAYGLSCIGFAEIEKAAEIAQLHDFVSQLPDGYDTLIGENACRLSQGIKQRVALARAIVRESDLLILDEATSSIDSATEEKIFSALRQERQGKSTIVISHRLFSIKDADCIYYLRQDGIVEQGAHKELLAKSDSYCTFFQRQIEEARVASVVIPG
ncbi:MAG: ABC transporter ATP-binding protein [Candidatus Omnitrophota bacterium]